ncbi:MAG: CoA transferase [Hyphomonadaceae bacterium]|nr:CoA transferase [Hyphomonadaceae bacterium]
MNDQRKNSQKSKDGRGALDGLRVLDLSRVLAGPWCAQMLADLGADVIKVERPGRGDDSRALAPFLKDANDKETMESAYFLCANRGKRSITLDLSSKSDQEKLRTLASMSDVVIENYKVGTLRRYGLDYETLSKENSRLIYCSITGFGQTGPYAQRAAYDTAVQAMGGLMSITGTPDSDSGGGPQKVGVPVVDVLTGVYASTGILAALNERTRSGLGQHIDISLLDVCIASLSNAAASFLLTSIEPVRSGNLHSTTAPSDLYRCSDGSIIINIGNNAQFIKLCNVLKLDAIAVDPRFSTNTQRLQHREELESAVRAAFARGSVRKWVAELEAASVPCGPINSFEDVFSDPQVKARGVVRKVKHSLGEDVSTVSNPIRLSRTPINYEKSAPLLGEHNADIDKLLDGR